MTPFIRLQVELDPVIARLGDPDPAVRAVARRFVQLAVAALPARAWASVPQILTAPVG